MEYHKIETLFERDEKTHKVYPDRLKNPVYGIFKSWQFTEKVDGTNIRVIWECAKPESPERLRWGGKTDNAQLPADLVTWLTENVTAEKLRAVFPDADAVIYGEGYGAGIQKGGAYSPTKQFIVFDVLVGGQWWLAWENTCGVAEKLGIKTVPFIGNMTLEEGVAMVKGGLLSVLAKEQTGQDYQMEGLVLVALNLFVASAANWNCGEVRGLDAVVAPCDMVRF